MENTTELPVLGYSSDHVKNNVSTTSDIKTLAKEFIMYDIDKPL